MSRFICPICGYIYEGDFAPEKCPICKCPSSKFMNEDGVVAEENDFEEDVVETLDNNLEEDKETTQKDDQVIDDSDVYEVIQEKGLDKAAVWYKNNNYCSMEEAKDIVMLIKEKYDAANNVEITNDLEEKKKTPYYIIIGIIVIALIIIGALYSNSNQSEQNTDVVLVDSVLSADSVEMDIKSPEYVKVYLENILNKAIKIPEERAVEKYFTKDFIRLYKEIETYDKENIEPGNLGFWDFDFWTGGQDGSLDSVSVLEIPMINKRNATVIVQYLITFGKYDESKTSTEFSLLFEDNEWRIDDFNNYKWRFKDYLESPAIQEEVSEPDTTEIDTTNVY